MRAAALVVIVEPHWVSVVSPQLQLKGAEKEEEVVAGAAGGAVAVWRGAAVWCGAGRASFCVCGGGGVYMSIFLGVFGMTTGPACPSCSDAKAWGARGGE